MRSEGRPLRPADRRAILSASVPRRAGWGALVLCFLVACRSGPEPFVPPPPPTPDQLREDLVGARFSFFEDADGPRFWTIEAGEIRRFHVVDQVVDDSGRVARSRLSLTLRSEYRSILGDLVLRHARQDSTWVLDDAARVGPSWQATDAAATIFAVRVLSDSTLSRRTLALEPVVRYERGRYLDPLAAFRREAAVLFDSSFASDSLRLLAEADLNRRAAQSLAGRAVHLLGAGRAPVRARVDSARARVMGCAKAAVFASPADPEPTRWAQIATTSSVMGTPAMPGEPLPRDLMRALETVARQRFEVAGFDPSRLRSHGSTAADLDGDGQLDAVGAFSLGEGEGRVGLALGVGAEDGPSRVLFERQSTPANGLGRFDLLGVLDIDADGAAEALFLEEGASAYRALVVTYRAGRFTDAFRGGGGGC